jgi:hypothetical protein
MIRRAFFCSINTFEAVDEAPQKIIPYFVIDWILAK